MTAPVSTGGSDRSGNRSAGGYSKSKDNRSPDVNSAGAGKGVEVRKLNETLGLSPVNHAHYHVFNHVSLQTFIQNPNSGSQPKGASLVKADADPKGGERRGSNIYSSIDDDVPLTHKTGTVGIVALAIRNKNETKKQREFKVSIY